VVKDGLKISNSYPYPKTKMEVKILLKSNLLWLRQSTGFNKTIL